MQTAEITYPFLRRPLSLSLAACLFCVLLAPASPAPASAQTNQDADRLNSKTAPVVPQQVPFAGKLTIQAGKTVEAIFRIYAAPESGEPLWTETQRIPIAEDGSYSVLLGAASPDGLPQSLFEGGVARWLGVTVDPEQEAPRLPLSSVPYSMKSADAELLAGHAPSEFVTRNEFTQFIQSLLAATQTSQSSQLLASSPKPALSPGAITGLGTANYIPLWNGSYTQGNSAIEQLGANTSTTKAALYFNGYSYFFDTTSLIQAGTATTATGYGSSILDFIGSVWNSSTAAPVLPHFRILTKPSGNNTSSPTATLNFEYLLGNTTTNILSMNSAGVISFAPTQTFPGTINSVTGTSPVTATTTSGTVTLGFNTSALETTLNSVYPQLGTYNTFTSGASFGNTISAVTSSANAVYADVTGTGFAGYFLSNSTADSTVYAENDATGNPGLGIALKGYVPNAGSIGVLGKSAGANSYGVYAENVGGTDSYGVYAYTSGPGSTAIYAKAAGGADSNSVTGSGVVAVSSSGNGVEGISLGSSATGTALGAGGTWGVWGDTSGQAGLGFGAGVLGSADDDLAGFFENNGPDSPTINVINNGAGQAASFDSKSTSEATMQVTNSATASAAEMVNYSSTAVTLYLSNNSTGGIIDQVAKTTSPASDGLFKTLMASTPTGTCGIGGNGDLSCTGQVKSLVSTGGGTRKVETYATQSAENWMEDYGTGEMERGVALVKIDPAFAEIITESADYHVFITPNADAEALYVIHKTPTSFEVRESKGGTSSLTFDYKIVGKRRSYEAQRLVDVTDRFNDAQRKIPPATSPNHAPGTPRPGLREISKTQSKPVSTPTLKPVLPAQSYESK